jgi:hypothetical protein
MGPVAPIGELGVQVSRARVARLLLAIILLLHLANVPAAWFRQLDRDFFGRDLYIDLFSVSSEGTIPTWLSASALLVCAGLLGLIARATKVRGARDARYWTGLAVLFLLMSADEACAIHERLGGPVRNMLGLEGFARFAWVIPAIAFVAVLGAVYVPFLFRLLPRTRRWFLAAGFLYLGGSVGMEMASGAHAERRGPGPGYEVLAALEEVLEMSGVAVFLWALLDHLGRCASATRITVT